MEIFLIKGVNVLFPWNEEEEEKLKQIKMGSMVRCKVTVPTNPKFRHKWWVLAKLAFDFWTEHYQRPMHKGIEIEPNFDKFRKDLTIDAGFFHWVIRLNGDVEKEADSLAWGSMKEETFTKLYSASINVVLKEVYKMQMTEEQLRNAVEEIISFS